MAPGHVETTDFTKSTGYTYHLADTPTLATGVVSSMLRSPRTAAYMLGGLKDQQDQEAYRLWHVLVLGARSSVGLQLSNV